MFGRAGVNSPHFQMGRDIATEILRCPQPRRGEARRFGGFPDGAGFPLQSFLRQKRISAPIPNPRRLRGLCEKAEWESLIRNFWGLDNVDLMLSHALSMLYLCSIHTLVHSPPMLRLDYKAIQKMLPNF